MFWFIVILLVAGAGFYFYRKMMAIEREIRESQSLESGGAAGAPTVESTAQSSSAEAPEKVEPLPAGSPQDSAEVPPESPPEPGEGALLAEVIRMPGIPQTELYPLLSGMSRKQAQQLLKNMAEQGRIRREKQGNSYRVYPAENSSMPE